MKSRFRMAIPIMTLLLCELSFGESAQMFGQYERMRTSDELELAWAEFRHRNHRRDPLYRYSDEEMEALDYEVGVQRFDGEYLSSKLWSTHLFGSAAWSFSKQLFIEIGSGFQTLGQKDMQSENYTHSSRLVYQPKDEVILDIRLKRDLLFSYGLLPGPFFGNLSEWKLSPAILWQPTSRIKFHLSQEFALISDRNQRYSSDGSLLYGLSLWPTWLWVGVGYEYMSNSHSSRYWSPKSFRSYGLRSELAHSITDSLSVVAGLNLSKIQEEQFDKGNAHYFSVGLIFGQRERPNFKLELTDLKSAQGTSTWTMKSFSLSFNHFF